MKRRSRPDDLPNPYHLLLRELTRSGVDYIVIGVSGINYFAKDARQILSTADYDLFLKPTPENIRIAWKAFRKSGYSVAVREGRTMVAVGPYQLVVEGLLVVSGYKFDELKRNAVWMRDRKLKFRFLVGSLADLLESKRMANREKDRLFLARYKRLLLDD